MFVLKLLSSFILMMAWFISGLGPVQFTKPIIKPARVQAVQAVPATTSAEDKIESAEDSDQPVYINFFYSFSCPHCAKEASFIEQLAENNDRVEVRAFEVSQNQANAQLFVQLGQKLETSVAGVPFTAIGTKTFIGYQDDQTTGQEIEAQVNSCLAAFDESCQDQLAPFLAESELESVTPSVTEHSPASEPEAASVTESETDTRTETEIDVEDQSVLNKQLSLPFVGQVQVKDLSLPLLTFLVALLDGFNPCAMWVLVFLISLLLGMKDRRRMWLLGTAFIVTSALVYFLFLAAWLNLFLFLGLVFWVRLGVALVALAAGVYCLYDFATNKEAACKVTQPKKRKKVFQRLKLLVKKKNLWVALLGICLLAVAVNLVELVCSAGLPAVYTQVLTLSQLSPWQYYAYLLFYIIIFMLDDMIVFGAAMMTLKLTGIESRYARYSRLIGGIIMLLIGLLLILKPEWLMFA